jgi:hypothetical protein
VWPGGVMAFLLVAFSRYAPGMEVSSGARIVQLSLATRPKTKRPAIKPAWRNSGEEWNQERDRYLFSRVSMVSLSPLLMNCGTCTVNPVSITAGLYDAEAVAFFIPGSVSVTVS